MVDGDVVPAAPPLPEAALLLGCNREEGVPAVVVPGATVDRISRLTLGLTLLNHPGAGPVLAPRHEELGAWL
ncbi:hypothetical protein [Streptomyces sp. NPDC102437]|uniref:hypothetical protein n=1 Tax=Streptomyces sp. NPDC102437 TaxID=3366175 RepID=UPI0037F56CE0